MKNLARRMLAFLIVSIFMMSTFVFAADGDGTAGKLTKKVVPERNFRGYYQGPGTLFLSKEWRTVDGDEIEGITESVTFRIYDSSGVEVAVVNLPNTAGQYSTNLALDPGEGYTILEDPIDGYMPMYPDDNNSFNIDSEQTTPMVVSNMPVGYLHLQKQWFDATGNDITEDMNDVAVFKLYREGVEFIEIELTPDGQVGETYMTDLVLPVGNYRIEEEYIPGFITEYEVYSYDATSPTQSDEFEIVQGMETVVFPKNTVDSPTTGTLELVKEWQDENGNVVNADIINMSVTIIIKDSNGNEVGRVTIPAGQSSASINLPEGSGYTVEEDVPAGYSVTYLLNGDVFDTFSISPTYVPKIKVINKKDSTTPAEGRLELEKEWQDENGDPMDPADVNRAVTFYIKDSNGNEIGRATIPAGDSSVYLTLPEGSGYTITEDTPAGYTTSYLINGDVFDTFSIEAVLTYIPKIDIINRRQSPPPPPGGGGDIEPSTDPTDPSQIPDETPPQAPPTTTTTTTTTSVVVDDITDDDLPKTGGIPMAAYLVLGCVVVGVGLTFKKKK